MIKRALVRIANRNLCEWTSLILVLFVFGGCKPETDDGPVLPSGSLSPLVVEDEREDSEAPSPASDAHSADPKPDAPDPGVDAHSKPEEKPSLEPVEKPAEKPTLEAPEKPKTADPPPSNTGDDPKPEKVQNPPPSNDSEDPRPVMAQSPPPSKDNPPDPAPSVPPAPPQKPTLPAHLQDKLHQPLVVMSKAHEDSCLVKVGDAMPELSLSDLQGEQHTLSSLSGQTLTVVVVWSQREALGKEQFRRLATETWDPFRKSGVQVVAINTGEAVDDVRSFIEQAEIEFPCLFDSDGTAMAALASHKLPRTYLLDETGKILWLDIEYSSGSRRELENALYFFLLRED